MASVRTRWGIIALGSGWLVSLGLLLERALGTPGQALEEWRILSGGAAILALTAAGCTAARFSSIRRSRTHAETEAKLRQRERELWQVLDLIPNYVFAKDEDGHFFIINKTFADAYGMSVPEILGRTNAELSLSPEVVERLGKADQDVIATGRTCVFEEEFTTIDGVTQTVRTTKIPFTRAGTYVPAILGVAVDVTERRRAEDALRLSEERYRRAIAEAGAVPYQRDYATDSFAFMGEEIERITGFPAHEITVSKWNSLIQELILRGEASGKDLDESRTLVREGNLRRWQADVRIRTRWGETRWIFDSSIQLVNEEGIVTGALGILQDVTERMQTEVALRESEARFRTLLENTADPLFVYDLSGCIADVNQQACSSLGYSREELLRMKMSDLDPQTSHGYEDIKEQIASLGPQTATAQYRRRDGSLLPVEVRASCLEISGRSLILALARDVSERTRAERERDLFSTLALDLTSCDTPEKVAHAVRHVTDMFWCSDAFFLSVRVSGQARYRIALKHDTLFDGSRIEEEDPDNFYEAGLRAETVPLYSGNALLINRNEADTPAHPADGRRYSASLMYSPMRAGNRLQGVLSIQSYTRRRFSQQDLDLLQRIADAAAPALERCRAERRATGFLKLGEELSYADTPEDAARTIARAADEALGWDAAFLFFYSREENRAHRLLSIDIVDGKKTEISGDLPELNPVGNMRQVISEEKPLLLLRDKLPAAGEFLGSGNRSRPSASIIWVPIRALSGIIGLFSVQSYTRNAYDGDDVETVAALAAQAAGALERTLAQKALREREARYRQAIAGAGAVPYQLDYIRHEYVFVGEGIEQITGYMPEEFSAATMRSMVLEVIARGEGTGLNAREAAHKVRQSDSKEWLADICIRTRSGEIRWLSDISVQIYDDYGTACGSLGILQDITERKLAEKRLQESEERYRRTITEAGAVPYQRDYSNASTFTFIGDGITQITGYSPDEITFDIWEGMIEEVITLGETDGLELTEAVQRTRDGHFREWRADVRIRTRNGEIRWLSDTSIQLQRDGGKPYGALGILIDITERKKAEQALRTSEERYALAAQAANDGLWDWDLRTNTIYYGPRWKEMLGLNHDEVYPSPEEWFGRVHPEDVVHVREEIARHLAGQASAHFQVEYRIVHKLTRAYRHMLCRGLAVRNSAGEAYRIAGSQTDVTDRHDFEQQLVHDALHDALTGLPNRLLLMDRLRHALERARNRGEYGFALVFIDLDRFKVFNDSLGHLAGDLLLKTVARRLELSVRPGDTVARFAGDEFTVLLEDLGNLDDARLVADRMLMEIAQPMSLEGQVVYTTASMGIALGTPAYKQPEELLRDADNALYRAKAAGKARYEVFDPSMHAHAVEALELETELRRAISEQELTLHYQPIVSLQSGRIVGFEALARWNHPQRGLISPAAFIPLAEETGLIMPMGEWLVREAAQCLLQWQEEFGAEAGLIMSINLSGRQFARSDLADSLEQTVHEVGVTPHGIALEITESVLMQNPEEVAPQLERLRRAGFSIHLDDFGTGYSSFSYLHRFPITSLKIDRSFVSQMGAGTKEIDITRSIIHLAGSLGLGVTAEGVETEAQLNHLRDMGCACVQGYLLARPAPAEVCAELLRRKPTW